MQLDISGAPGHWEMDSAGCYTTLYHSTTEHCFSLSSPLEREVLQSQFIRAAFHSSVTEVIETFCLPSVLESPTLPHYIGNRYL